MLLRRHRAVKGTLAVAGQEACTRCGSRLAIRFSQISNRGKSLTIRKHINRIPGKRLLELLAPAKQPYNPRSTQVQPIRQVRPIRPIRELGESQTSFRIRIQPAYLPDHPALRIPRCSPDSWLISAFSLPHALRWRLTNVVSVTYCAASRF